MTITAIKQQARRNDRYSIFVDGKYAFSLSAGALLEQRLTARQEISDTRLSELKQMSNDDKLYNQALRYVMLRPRSRWEAELYLKRKNASLTLAEEILNKLSDMSALDDHKFTKAFVRDRRLLRPTSRRKLVQQLRQKNVADEIIQAVVGSDTDYEQAALKAVIDKKRQQPKYRDDLKLMQYLAGQGFSYGDIKAALKADTD